MVTSRDVVYWWRFRSAFRKFSRKYIFSPHLVNIGGLKEEVIVAFITLRGRCSTKVTQGQAAGT